MLFVKTFTDSKGRKIYYFKSVTVKKDGLEVSVSSHYDRPKRIKEALKKGKLLYRFDGGAQTEQRPADVSVATSREVSQGTSLAGKVSESPETKQEKAEKSISAKVKEASADVNTEPTEAQKEAGNYKKGHVQVGTFDITIEQPEGSIRRGTDANGKQWESKMHNTYGYFRGTEGVDGDHIDVFLSNDIDGWNGAQVFVVDQYNPDGTFDEHKVMLGFNDASDAKNNYLANYEKGWENGRRIDVSAVSLADFEKWIASSHRKTKPFSEYKSVKPADDSETFKGHKVENSGKDIEVQIKHLEEIKDYPGADKKIVQSEIDRLKAKEEAKVKSKPKEENGVDDAKIDAVLEALDKGKEKAARRLASKLTNKELSKARSKAKPSFLLEYEWQWRAQNRGDVSLHDWMLENQYVEPVKRVSGTFRITDYTAPKDSPYAERLGGVFHDNSGFAVATDARILAASKDDFDPKLKGKVIGKDGTVSESKFPDWQKAIPPAKETKSSNIDVEDLRKFVAGVLRANKRAYISLRFPDGTVEVFKANRLNLMLRAMKQLGTSELLYTKYGMKLVAKSEKGTALLMGLVSVEDELVEANGYAYDKYRKADLEREKANNAPETNKTGAFGTIYTQFKGKAKEAIAFLLEKKEGEAVGALHHKDIGDIDLVWGKEDTGKSDGFGLAKLVKYHPEVLDDLQEILDDMTVVKKNANRVQLESKTHKASVRLAWDKEKKNWLLTAYEKKNSASDNTTDIAETAMSGKRNDTATPQNTVSAGKVSESPETKQEKDEKSAEDSQNKIIDVGEKISGARKDLLRDFSNKLKETTLESLITLPFSKAFKRPDLKTAVEQGLLRQRDARFAEAVMATYLSKNKPRLLSGWKKGESQKNLEAWAKDAYFGVQTLRALFEADKTTRDKLIDEILSAKPYREDDIDRRKKQLEEWNPGKKFEGKCYPLNPVVVYMAVYERLGYDNIGEFKLPVSSVGSSTFFDHYELTDNSGKKIYPTRALQSFEDVVDEITYLSKVKNADEDTDHPNSIFRLAGINPVWESTGWRVLTLGTSSSKRPETHLFKTKEEAEKFAEEYKAGGKGRQASTPIENKELIGYGNYELRFHLGEKDISTGLTFSSKKDARAAIDTEHEKLNAIVNEKLAKARESGGKNEKRPQKDYVRIQAYTEDGKTWKYAVVLDERYAPKSTAFNTLPYSLANGFSTRKEAVAYIEKHRVEWDAKIDDINRRRKDFVFLNGSSERVGEDYRKGEDITAEQFREQFGFRGVQFGNWTNQKDRQAALNNAFDSFMDLAKILGISPKAVSLNGELGIAFGARGGGGAKAHYEREEVVINLTKTMGAGSLAHEWWHALDNYFARRGNVKLGMVTEGKGIAMRGELRKAYDKLVSDTENSDYNRRSRDAGASYWGTRREETARMFAMWVFDEISKKGERNSFLTDNDPAAEERYAKGNYDFYVLMCGQDRPPMTFEEFRKSPSALAGYVYPSRQELEEFGADLRKIFDTAQERVDEETGNTVLYHRGEVVSEMSQEERVLRDAVIDRLRESGMEVITDEGTGQRVLDEANGKAKLSAKKRRALETVSASHDEKHQPTVVSSADGAKETATIAENSTNKATGISDAFANVQTNLENLARVYAEKVTNKTRGFITDLSKALKLTQHEASNYGSFALPNGETLAIRISNHNARVSNFDKNDENNGISIVISSHKNKGLNNDGKAHIIEYFYHRRAIENATGKPLADIVKSIEQALYSGEFKDITGLAQRQEVNAETIREHRVYHGSGADFDVFDHSHMGEGEGAQAYGWGTYVTEVEGIGRTYAEQNAQDVSPTEEDFEMMNAAISEKVLERFGGIDAELRVDYDGDGGFNLLDVPNNKEVLVKFRKYFENHPDEFDGYIEDYDLDDEYGRRDFADAVSASMLDFARKVAEDYKDKYWPTKQRILYTVEIPNDNGGNYLDWVAQTGSGLVTRIREALRADEGLNGLYEGRKSELNAKLEKFAPRMPFYEAYTHLGGLLGSDKAASELLSSLGFAGIKYPADNMRGGREDGAKNYVIFNEKDARITGHVRFFRTESGEAYGFTVGGKIYIDPKIANTETPIHEYAHLWAAALRGQNPKEWQNIVELMKGTSVWDEVKKRYPELNTDDDIADEVLATYSGRRGSERLREEQRKIAGGKGGVFEKAEAISALERVKQALRKFWKSVADFLHIHYKSAEEVADRVMKDLLDGVDPRKHFNSRNDDPRFMFAGEKGAARADRGEEALTRQNNLDVAQKMEAAKKEAKAIKLATGWERGADGKWRYEIPDGIYHPKGDAELKKALAKQPWREELNGLSDRILDGKELSKEETERFNELAEKEAAFKADYLKKEKPHLADWLENDELFKAYPELKRVGVVFTDNMPKEQAGYYDSKSNTITVNTNSSEDTASIIAHEVQHAIQRYEGFATGGNLKAAMEYLSGNKRADVKIKQQLAYKLSQEKGLGLSEEEVNSLIGHLEYEDISDDELQKQIDALCQKHNITEDQLEDIYPMDSVWHEAYNRISGEAEARNVQKRMGMTAEERRASLAADTEDVARDSQILLFSDTGKKMSLESPKEERIEKLRESKPVEITGEEITPSDDLKQYKRNALEYGKKLRGVYTNEDTGEQIELTGGNRRGGLREILQHDYKDKEHLQSIAAIPQIIEKAIFIDELPNEDRKNYPGVRAFRYYVCGLKIADVDYTVKAVIAEQNNGERYYDHKLTKIEKGKLLSIIPTIQKAGMDSDLPRSVGKDSRLLSILQVKDEKKPNRELYRAGSKELRDGRKIEFVRKPTATYNALARHLQAEGIKPDMHEARTGSRYMSFEKDGVQWEVRSSDHTKPEYFGEAQKPVELTYYKDKQGEENLSVSVDLGTSGYNIEDMKALMAEIDRLKNDAGEVKESFDKGVVSDEAAKRYPLLSQALGVKSENEVRAKEEAREHAEEARKQEMRSAVEYMAGKLHLNNVDIVDKPAGRGAGRRERAKGMFERSTGRITINIGNCADKRDAVVTLLHEAVAHHGLRKLFGENFETFLDNVYNSANAEIRRIIDKHSSRYGGDKRTATEEYMASLAERTDFENAKKSGWWQRIKDFFLKMLEKIGLKGFKGEDLSDNELRYVLWRSYENLKSGGKDTVISAADDLAKQSELKVGEFAPDAKAEGSVAALNTRFNNELQQQIDGNLPSNHIYQMGKPGQILRSTGVPDLPIQMNAKRLQDKATLFDHNFELYEVKDLVKALQNPLAVFSYGDKTKAQNIIVPLQKDGKNFIVGLSLNPTVGGKTLEINSIRNVFPKDNSEWLNWISQGKALYLDKEKIQTLIAQQRTNLADVEYLDLDSAAKVVENFENPKSESENDALFRDGDAKDYEKAQARETYEYRVSTGMFQSREAIQDSMLSLKVAMDAIEEATAGKAKRIEDYDGFENAYLGENRLSSVNQAESAAFAHLLIRPMMEEVNRLAPTAEDRAELIDYMFAKHGLERNAYMRQQAAEKKLAEYKKQNPGTAKTAADFIDAERDYAGLTTLTGEADVSAAEAEAQRMVADYEKDHTFHGTWNEIYVCRKKIC